MHIVTDQEAINIREEVIFCLFILLLYNLII
jgi:hypothetical protein